MFLARCAVALAVLAVPALASAEPPHATTETKAAKVKAKPTRTARIQKSEARTCTRPTVEVVSGADTATFSLTRCDGTPAPLAVDQLSILARPGSAPKPKQPLEALAKSQGRGRGAGHPSRGRAPGRAPGARSGALSKDRSGGQGAAHLRSAASQRRQLPPVRARARLPDRGRDQRGARGLLQDAARHRLRLLSEQSVRAYGRARSRCRPRRVDRRQQAGRDAEVRLVVAAAEGRGAGLEGSVRRGGHRHRAPRASGALRRGDRAARGGPQGPGSASPSSSDRREATPCERAATTRAARPRRSRSTA